MDLELKGTPAITMQFDGTELRDWGIQTVKTHENEPAFEAYVTEFVCPRCGLAGTAVVDRQLASLSGDAARFRLTEDLVFEKTFRAEHAAKQPNCR